MKKDFIVAVPKPCHEKWENFSTTAIGGYCSSCEKEVIDFTLWDEERIKRHFNSNQNKSTCGRFKPAQLKMYPSAPKAGRPWHVASVLTFLLLLLTRPSEAQTSRKKADIVKVDKENAEQHADTLRSLRVFGVVKDSESPIPGANVLRVGTETGTVTDADGKFSLWIDNYSSSDSLEISFIGFNTKRIPIPRNSQPVEVVVELDYSVLGGIVVGGAYSIRPWSPRGIWWKIKGIFRRG